MEINIDDIKRMLKEKTYISNEIVDTDYEDGSVMFQIVFAAEGKLFAAEYDIGVRNYEEAIKNHDIAFWDSLAYEVVPKAVVKYVRKDWD